jgi:phosphohistidine phosphatase SixA
VPRHAGNPGQAAHAGRRLKFRGRQNHRPRDRRTLTSPWLGEKTAAIAAAAWGHVEAKATAALAGGSFEQQAEVLDRYPKDATVAVVGHEPHVSELLARLVGSRNDDRLTFKKGGAALVDVPGRLAEGGELVWFLPPRYGSRKRCVRPPEPVTPL